MTDYLRIIAPFHNQTGYSRAARALLQTALLAGYEVEAVESDLEMVGAVRLSESGRPRSETWLQPHGETALPGAQKEEVETALQTTVPKAAPTIIYQLPHMMDEWREYTAGPRIGYTMVECDGVRPEVVEKLRGVDVLCTPSTYCAGVFRRALAGPEENPPQRRGEPQRTAEEKREETGAPPPVEVLPNAIDTRIYPECAAPPICLRRGRPSFLFSAVTTTHERKHWRELLHAFAEEFRGEDVGLFVKTNKPGDIDDLAFSCRDYGAWVQVDSSPWTDDMIAGLYGVTDCYALPSCEGFGLPFCEAALYGVPSVALDTGGQADVVTRETGYRVPTTMQPCVGLIPRYFSSEFRWAGCTVGDLRRTLRHAYEMEMWRKARAERLGPDLDGDTEYAAVMCPDRGRRARAHVMNNFTPGRLGVTLRQVVIEAEILHSRRTVGSEAKRNGHGRDTGSRRTGAGDFRRTVGK